MSQCLPTCSTAEDGLSQADRDQITDSVQACLALEVGRQQLLDFLGENHLEEHHSAAVLFWLKCEEIQMQAGRLSPESRCTDPYSSHLDRDFEELAEMAEGVNFDQSDLNVLYGAFSLSNEQKLSAIRTSQVTAMSLVEPIYNIFREKLVKTYREPKK